MVNLSERYSPLLLRGLIIHPGNPLQFDFILDQGEEHLNPLAMKESSQHLVNYFLASLAIPHKDLWVNLSPVEKGPSF